MTQESLIHHVRRESVSQPMPRPVSSIRIPESLETPISRPAYIDFIPSAMKGIVLTSTGETLATPSQAELANLFKCSPKLGLKYLTSRVAIMTERRLTDAGTMKRKPIVQGAADEGKRQTNGILVIYI